MQNQPDPDKKCKLSSVAPEYQTLVIEVLKACILYKDLLSQFERRFALEVGNRFAEYGFNMVVTGEQWNVFLDIAKKLNLKLEA